MSKAKTQLASNLYLKRITGKLLDQFLEKGWYRMGASIFTSHFILYETILYSSIWLRVRLQDYVFSKSLRKLNKKNSKLFSHTVSPFKHSEKLDDLYRAYKKNFKGSIPPTLSEYMTHSLDSDVYDTRIIKVYHDSRLIAASLFDVGEKSISSIFGFYHPEYTDYSLGLYTMVLELEYCMSNKMDFYYVGYFVPGNSRFDYKLRLGDMEYLELKSDEWRPIDNFDYSKLPTTLAESKLRALQANLTTPTSLYKNAFIDVHIIEYFPMKYIEAPYILILDEIDYGLKDYQFYVCYFDVKTEHYRLDLCDLLSRNFSNYNPEWLDGLDETTYKQQLVASKTIKICKTTKPIMRWLESIHLGQ